MQRETGKQREQRVIVQHNVDLNNSVPSFKSTSPSIIVSSRISRQTSRAMSASMSLMARTFRCSCTWIVGSFTESCHFALEMICILTAD